MTWTVGFSTGAFYNYPILSVLPAIRAAGFHHVEICTDRTHFAYDDAVAVERLRGDLDRLGLRVVSLHAPFGPRIDVSASDEVARGVAVEQSLAAARALQALGGDIFVVHPAGDNPPPHADRTALLSQSLKSLRSIHALCVQLKLRLAIETMLPHLLGGRIQEVLWLAERLPREGVGFCLDTGHTYLSSSLEESLAQLRPRLLLLHVHDNAGKHDDHFPPGQGKIDWASCVSTLRRGGFAGALILETTAAGSPEEHLRQAWRSTSLVRSPERLG